MKVLYVGGQKSGKSFLAEQKTLELAQKKPFYVATYDKSFSDAEMLGRIQKHLDRRKEQFVTIEEPLALERVIEKGESYLVDCLSMWIMNLMEAGRDYETILETILKIDANIVFVLNDVTKGIIPQNQLSRRFIDHSGVIGQIVAAACDEVYEVVVGLPKRLK